MVFLLVIGLVHVLGSGQTNPRTNARIKDDLAKEIIDTLGVDVSKYDPFMSHEGVVARTIMYRQQLETLIAQYPDALCINLGCGFVNKFVQVDNGKM